MKVTLKSFAGKANPVREWLVGIPARLIFNLLTNKALNLDTRKPSRMFCQICGHLHKIDFWVPDEIWDACIHPRYKFTHICLNCFIERADEQFLPWDKEIKLMPVSFYTQRLVQEQVEDNNYSFEHKWHTPPNN